MKIIMCVLFCIVSIANANEFRARQAYLNKNYSQARDMYLKLSNSEQTNPAHFYNLGAAYFRLNDYMNAKRYFLKVLKFEPGNKDALYNVGIINQKLIDQELFYKSYWTSIFGLSLNSVLVFVLIGAIPILFVNVYLIRVPTQSALKRPMVLMTFIWSIACLTIFILAVNEPQYGIVSTDKASVYSGPSQTQNVLFFAHLGADFRRLRSTSTWHQIQFSNGLKGWIMGKDIKEI
jgi:uncharacterized protein YgiM (DUF1202 family)